jgi:hypothetical protein
LLPDAGESFMTSQADWNFFNTALTCCIFVAPIMTKKIKMTAYTWENNSLPALQISEYGEHVMSVSHRKTTARRAITKGSKYLWLKNKNKE